MEETGILEKPDSAIPLIPAFEPGRLWPLSIAITALMETVLTAKRVPRLFFDSRADATAVAARIEDKTARSHPCHQTGKNGSYRTRIVVHRPTFEKIVAWARFAPSAEEPASLHQRIFLELDADRLAKTQSIEAVESELAGALARTPYVLLLSIVGINAVSAAEFAGEIGPIERYSKGRAISGRAGLFPSRYQSVLGEILPVILAKLEVNLVKSTQSGKADPTERPS